MEFTFYIAGLVAVLATLRVITNTNPVHALLYLVVSLLALSMVFFSPRRIFRWGIGDYRLRRCHYGSVCFRGHDA
ncbi:NADH-quinone oxidoreductase subunit J [Providencia rustigianii]|nr:NADH-quinone oxidoreductase subunit J [Providencia rustigianii]